ncbi:hypothetical protein [Kiloniella antarctica]|jgi:hypothetical protein|uniref:Tryptophan synthase subunit beta like protein n=1 Tax=Kiloniella antarctica TaxID=1550907 RepID=A0ABW5BNJ1_9PROT
MPYVSRSNDGNIIGLHDAETEIAKEFIETDSPELVAFLAQIGQTLPEDGGIHQELAASDMEMIRVLEDLITTLIDKRVLMMTDLPKAAQSKLSQRYSLRSKLTDLGGIVGENDEILLP